MVCLSPLHSIYSHNFDKNLPWLRFRLTEQRCWKDWWWMKSVLMECRYMYMLHKTTDLMSCVLWLMGFGLWCVAGWPVLSGNGRSIFKGMCLPITFLQPIKARNFWMQLQYMRQYSATVTAHFLSSLGSGSIFLIHLHRDWKESFIEELWIRLTS